MSYPTLTINGTVYELGSNIGSDDRLVNFIHGLKLMGTHITCYEGGCGACIVVASVPNPVTGEKDTFSVNSCLVPVLSCAGWDITTVEGLGSSRVGYHVIQDRLAQYSGTQCGYCTPGFVMNMYGLTQNNSSWTASDVEKCLDANLCRCTGYRPIMEAFKSITVQDIEDSHLTICKKTGKECVCKGSKTPKNNVVQSTKSCNQEKVLNVVLPANFNAYQPTSLQELYQIIGDLPEGERYSLIVGNTAQAVVGRDKESKTTIFIRNVPELLEVTHTTEYTAFGANISISRLISEMKTRSSDNGFAYLGHLANAWKHLAGTSIRNMGSWAGNIAIRISHKDFPSDIFTHLVAAGATITLGHVSGATTNHSIEDLLQMDLVNERKVIIQLTLPKMADGIVLRVFKVSPRSKNAHAYANAGFRIQVDGNNAHTVIGTPVIVYGCINSTFVHAIATEASLIGKSLEDNAVIQEAMAALAAEIIPTASPLEPNPEYKVALAQNLLYKAILGIIGDVAASDFVSGATDLERPLSSGQQTYDQNEEIWPLGKAIPKLEAHIQCSGEAEYIASSAVQEGELFGLFVTSTQANARIVSNDASGALEMPGVIAYVSLEDIGGENNIIAFSWPDCPQPLFPEERVAYYGQPVGLIVAENRSAAYAGAAAVQVTYDDIQPPILTIDEALQNPLPDGQHEPLIIGDIAAGFANSTHIIEGVMNRNGQYHFGMEPQVCIATPTDEGLDIQAGTQYPSETQRSIGKVLGIPDNKVNVTVKRIGGAFGSKIVQNNIIATATALAAQKTGSRVRVSLDFGDNMSIIGWREPYKSTYKVGVDDNGVLQAVQTTTTCDAGYVGVDISVFGALDCMPSCYACPNWEITPQFVLTNTACNTWCRAPGTMDGIVFMENIMDHVAKEIGMEPLEFRLKNMMPNGANRRINTSVMRLRASMAGQMAANLPREITVSKNLIPDMIEQIKVTSDYAARKQQAQNFNANNRWKKRGIALMPQLWPYQVAPVFPFNVMVSVNARDGSVTISHGGIEMGQGINTKVAQCAAYELGIPLSMIAIKASNTHVNANTQGTVGSNGSDIASFSVSIACRTLRQRLDEYKNTLPDPNISWPDLVLQAFNNGVDICERYVNKATEVKGYPVFGVAVTEVELDVLTGQFMILRTDILWDAGRSMSPLVDIGQVEGGFVMGQGLFTSEQPIYDPQTGKRLTNTTWHYKPPQAQDIPVDFRISFLQNAPNPIGVQSSKAIGEPPLIMSFSVVMALRQAISSAREDSGTTGWFQIDTPLTVEKVQRLCLVDPSRLVVHHV